MSEKQSDLSIRDLEAYLRAKGWSVASEWTRGRVWQAPNGKRFDVVETPRYVHDYGERLRLDQALDAIARIEGRPSPGCQVAADVARFAERQVTRGEVFPERKELPG